MNDYLRDRVTVAVGTQYLIENEIGRGGMAVVYRATDTRLGRAPAIKMLPADATADPDRNARFVRPLRRNRYGDHGYIRLSGGS